MSIENDADHSGLAKNRFVATSEEFPSIVLQCPRREESVHSSSTAGLFPIITDVDFQNKRATLDSSTHSLDFEPLMPQRAASLSSDEDDETNTFTSASSISDITDFAANSPLSSEKNEGFITFTDKEQEGDDCAIELPSGALSLPCRRLDLGKVQSDQVHIERTPAKLQLDLQPICPRPNESISPLAPQSALRKLADAFAHICPVGTHSYLLKKYDKTFVGSEAIDFMLREGLASSREDAVFLGQRFCKELNLFHHVCWDHPFKDGFYFYRFTDKESDDMSSLSLPSVSSKQLRAIASSFSRGMVVSTHKLKLSSYKETFSGKEAVDHMVTNGLASNRIHAVFLGQRIMEEIGYFHHITREQQFKDAPYLYRFIKQQPDSVSSDDSLMTSLNARCRKQNSTDCSSRSLLTHSSMCRTLSSSSVSVSNSKTSTEDNRSSRKPKKAVSFGNILERCFERCIVVNPATSAGPSIGLGWQYYDVPPIPIEKSPSTFYARPNKLRLSQDARLRMLKEWGHSKAEINKAAKSNDKIRRQRKQTLNNTTLRTT